MHKARWMSKVLYSLKLWMFQEQVHLSENEKSGLTDMVKFIVMIYFEAWFECTSAIKAPFHDLKLIKKLDSYRSINQEIAEIATKKFLNHLWYLNEQNVAFSFFDENVSIEMKEKMVNSLKSVQCNNPIRATLELEEIQEVELSDFVTAGTIKFFDIIDLIL